jgi:hypothetical protein
LTIICGSAVWYSAETFDKIIAALCLLFPALFILVKIYIADQPTDYPVLSLRIKLFMFIGLIYWCMLS